MELYVLYLHKKTFSIFENLSQTYVHHRIICLISAEQGINTILFENFQIFTLHLSKEV